MGPTTKEEDQEHQHRAADDGLLAVGAPGAGVTRRPRANTVTSVLDHVLRTGSGAACLSLLAVSFRGVHHLFDLVVSLCLHVELVGQLLDRSTELPRDRATSTRRCSMLVSSVLIAGHSPSPRRDPLAG